MQEVGRTRPKLVRLLEPIKLKTVSILETEESSENRESKVLIHTRPLRQRRKSILLHDFYSTLEPEDRHLSLYEVYKQTQKERNSQYRRRRPHPAEDRDALLIVSSEYRVSATSKTPFSNQYLSNNCSPQRQAVPNRLSPFSTTMDPLTIDKCTTRYNDKSSEATPRGKLPLYNLNEDHLKIKRRRIVSLRRPAVNHSQSLQHPHNDCVTGKS